MLVDFGSSSGWWIVAEVEDNQAFFASAMGSNWQSFFRDIWQLDPRNPHLTIEEFKTRWDIQDLKELHYKTEGNVPPFSIVDNEYVQE